MPQWNTILSLVGRYGSYHELMLFRPAALFHWILSFNLIQGLLSCSLIIDLIFFEVPDFNCFILTAAQNYVCMIWVPIQAECSLEMCLEFYDGWELLSGVPDTYFSILLACGYFKSVEWVVFHTLDCLHLVSDIPSGILTPGELNHRLFASINIKNEHFGVTAATHEELRLLWVPIQRGFSNMLIYHLSYLSLLNIKELYLRIRTAEYNIITLILIPFHIHSSDLKRRLLAPQVLPILKLRLFIRILKVRIAKLHHIQCPFATNKAMRSILVHG